MYVKRKYSDKRVHMRMPIRVLLESARAVLTFSEAPWAQLSTKYIHVYDIMFGHWNNFKSIRKNLRFFPASKQSWATVGPPAKRHKKWRFAGEPTVARFYMFTRLFESQVSTPAIW